MSASFQRLSAEPSMPIPQQSIFLPHRASRPRGADPARSWCRCGPGSRNVRAAVPAGISASRSGRDGRRMPWGQRRRRSFVRGSCGPGEPSPRSSSAHTGRTGCLWFSPDCGASKPEKTSAPSVASTDLRCSRLIVNSFIFRFLRFCLFICDSRVVREFSRLIILLNQLLSIATGQNSLRTIDRRRVI